MIRPRIIKIPSPTIGGKIWLLHEKGLFVLEQEPGTLRTIACTHAGSGSIAVYDGIPDEKGFFPDEGMPETHPDWGRSNGRLIYSGTPVVMGSWMMDGHFNHGLSILASGGTDSTCAVASIVWTTDREDSEGKLATRLDRIAKDLSEEDKIKILSATEILRRISDAKSQTNS